MADGFLLSAPTAARVEEIISSTPGDGIGTPSGGGVRQVIHVLVTKRFYGSTSTSDDWYEGYPTCFNVDLEAWEDLDEKVLVRDCNDNCLRIGDRYGCLRYGYLEQYEKYGFVTLGAADAACSSSSSSSSSSSNSSSSFQSSTSTSTSFSDTSTSGSGVEVVTEVTCFGGLQVGYGTLTGTVTIGGKAYPVALKLEAS